MTVHVKDMTLYQAREYETELVKQMRYARASEFEVIGWDLDEVRERIRFLTGED
jgi:hypothetical protein